VVVVLSILRVVVVVPVVAELSSTFFGNIIYSSTNTDPDTLVDSVDVPLTFGFW